jgi:hypothetical protein
MLFRGLVLALLLSSTFSFAQGRKPAVEDFVGIEVEQDQVAPQGTESLYNLEQDLNKIHEQKDKPAPTIAAPAASSGWSVTNMVSLAFILGLPVMIWLMIMNHLKRKASVESASNIEVLEKYRKEREKKNEESDRMAS